MNYVGSLDSSRDLQPIRIKKSINRLYLVLHVCFQIRDVMFFAKVFWHLNTAYMKETAYVEGMEAKYRCTCMSFPARLRHDSALT